MTKVFPITKERRTDKGLLMNKTNCEEMELQLVSRQKQLYQAMETLCRDFQEHKAQYGVNWFDLVIERTPVPRFEHEADPLVRYVVEWTTRSDIRKLCPKLSNKRRRVHPFNPDHESSAWVQNTIFKHLPSYYNILAAYDDVRASLNYSYLITRTLYLELIKHRENGIHFDADQHEVVITKVSRQLLKRIDSQAPVSNILAEVFNAR